MEYQRLVAARRQLWDEFEQRLAAARSRSRAVDHAELEQLACQYRQILHDHALLRARFPQTGAADRLSRLALAGAHWLQREPQRHTASIGYFFGTAFPRAFRLHLRHLALAAALFLLAGLFGFALATVQPGLGTMLLGPERIADLKQGHLWTESLTSAIPPSFSSSLIATNNMSVALTGWAGGALAGLGSLYVIVLNGLMLGCILAVTVHYHMAPALLEFVAAHGPLEITLILVCTGAGLSLAQALIVAEDRPRWQAVRERAVQSMVLVLGCLPWFIVLGLVEGFISPMPDLPPQLKILLGLMLEALFLIIAARSPTAGGNT